MNLFEKVHVRSFRHLRNVELKLKPLNVLIGANGSGKTSLLDVFSLLAASAAGKQNETMSDLGGIEGNRTNLKIAKEDKKRGLTFDLVMNISDDNPLEYYIGMASQGVGYMISGESLFQL